MSQHDAFHLLNESVFSSLVDFHLFQEDCTQVGLEMNHQTQMEGFFFSNGCVGK